MRSLKCASGIALALHRVFIAPIDRPLYSLCARPSIPIVSKLFVPKLQYRAYASRSAPQQVRRRLPRDSEIKSKYVFLVREDGTLPRDADRNMLPPQHTATLLLSIDRNVDSLVTVAMPQNEKIKYEASSLMDENEGKSDWQVESSNSGLEFPLVKIQSKKSIREAEKARTKKKDNPSATTKTIELNWAIDGNDLKHRLDRMKEFLAKGFKVEILMAAKKKGRKASIEEAQSLLVKIRAAMAECEGSREWKTMDGQVAMHGTMYLEGKRA